MDTDTNETQIEITSLPAPMPQQLHAAIAAADRIQLHPTCAASAIVNTMHHGNLVTGYYETILSNMVDNKSGLDVYSYLALNRSAQTIYQAVVVALCQVFGIIFISYEMLIKPKQWCNVEHLSSVSIALKVLSFLLASVTSFMVKGT
eukprot:223080_1